MTTLNPNRPNPSDPTAAALHSFNDAHAAWKERPTEANYKRTSEAADRCIGFMPEVKAAQTAFRAAKAARDAAPTEANHQALVKAAYAYIEATRAAIQQ